MRYKNFTGKDGFVWWYGVVEDVDDPEFLGRCKVRCIGYHPSKNKGTVPTEDLPWALCLQPNNTPNLYATLRKGDMVVGFFLDSHSAQEPVILGYLPGKITDGYDYENSFSFAPPSRTFEKVKNNYTTNPNSVIWNHEESGSSFEMHGSSGKNAIKITHSSGSSIIFNADGTINIKSASANGISLNGTTF
tara:strand:- start:759 stop:1328 length:570 start_codon:yes stop_codon:yes gene_type:complete